MAGMLIAPAGKTATGTAGAKMIGTCGETTDGRTGRTIVKG